MMTLFALLLGAVLDLIFGDPRGFPHLVVGIGRLISLLERGLRRLFPQTPKGELWGGGVLAFLVVALSSGLTWGMLALAGLVHPLLRLALAALISWQCLALRSLRDAGLSVYRALLAQDLATARLRVGEIVGRDTDALGTVSVTRAAVETIAENTSDGVIAPLLFLAVGGAPLGVLYKAINTLDSMVGYKNERYLYFGRVSARLDDVTNYLPARIAALLMLAVTKLTGLSLQNAWRIYRRDHGCHTSPNSAHAEAVAAGALGVRLGGNSTYGGRLVSKPTIGDATRAIEPMDILRTNRLLVAASGLCLILCSLIRGGLIWL